MRDSRARWLKVDSGAAWGRIPPLLLTNQEILGKLLALSVAQFIHLLNGNNYVIYS